MTVRDVVKQLECDPYTERSELLLDMDVLLLSILDDLLDGIPECDRREHINNTPALRLLELIASQLLDLA